MKPATVIQAGLVATLATVAPAFASDAQHPAVVEIFQSQGCSSCPPANANVIALSRRADILALSFGVTYWDHLGWKDTFASPQYTSRQWDYARAFHRNEVFTPEVVVNGRADVVGVDRGELETVIAREDRHATGPRIALASDRVEISAGEGRGDVWLVRYNPALLQVPIGRGENAGVTLPHKNVVRSLVRLGVWSGGSRSYRLPAGSDDGLRSAILVQDGPGGPIIAAARD